MDGWTGAKLMRRREVKGREKMDTNINEKIYMNMHRWSWWSRYVFCGLELSYSLL